MKQSLRLNLFLPSALSPHGLKSLRCLHPQLSDPSTRASPNHFFLFQSSPLSLPSSLLITLLWSCALSVPISLSLAEGSVQRLNAIRQRSRVVLINR